MRKLLFIIGVLLCAAPHARAVSCVLTSGASQSAILSAATTAGSGSCTGGSSYVVGVNTPGVTSTQVTIPATNVVLISSGVTINVSSTMSLPCGSQTYAIVGPPISLIAAGGIPQAHLNWTGGSNTWGVQINSCGSQQLWIQNLEWNGNHPSPGGGGFAVSNNGAGNWHIVNNYIHGFQGDFAVSNFPDNGEGAVYYRGVDTGTAGYTTSSNTEVTWNQIGPINASPTVYDCSNLMNTSNYGSSGSYGATGGTCGSVGDHETVINSTQAFNRNWGVEQAYKGYTAGDNGKCGGSTPTQCVRYALIYQNLLMHNNDIRYVHRNTVELQGRAQGNPGYLLQYNDTYDVYNQGYTGMGYSIPSCCGGLGTVHPSNTTVLDNIALATSGKCNFIPEAFEWWSDSNLDHNLAQGNWGACSNGTAASIEWAYTSSPNTYSVSYNYLQSPTNPACCGWDGINNEEAIPASQQIPPIMTGNVNQNTANYVPITTPAPTISPAPSNISGATTVTISPAAINNTTAGPRGNATVYYTTDGSNPTTSSTACYLGCSVTISPNTTVKAITMWGSLNQPKSYPAGMGFVPSAIQTWFYGSSGSAPTVTSAAIILQGGGNAVQVGNSVQACAVISYSSGVPQTVCSGSDSFGNTPNTWTSSSPSVASVTSTGKASGLSAGSTNLQVHVAAVTSSIFGLNVTASAPTQTAIAPACTNSSVAIGQTTQCSATCTYTGGIVQPCPTTTWTSLDGTIATVNSSSGVATGVAQGSTFIQSAAGGFSGSVPLSVTTNAPPAATLNGLTAACPGSVIVGNTTTCSATCSYFDGTNTTTTSCTNTDAHGNDANFASSASGTATITGAGVATGVTVGSVTITASVGGFNATAPLAVVAQPAGTNIGQINFDDPGVTYPGSENAQYFAIPSGTTATTSGCSFYLPTGSTYTAGGKYDCLLTVATSPTAQASAPLCFGTYTTLGTSADVGWHFVSWSTCGPLGSPTAATAYWIGITTNIQGPIGQGFYDCGGSCAGGVPTSGVGTYKYFYALQNYGSYTGNATAMNATGTSPGIQMSAYITLTTPTPTLTGGYLIVPGSTANLQVNNSIQFFAAACYSDGNCYLASPGPDQYGDVLTSITSSAPSVLSVNPIGGSNPGLAVAHAAGTAIISAVIGSKPTSTYGFTVMTSPAALPPISPRVFAR